MMTSGWIIVLDIGKSLSKASLWDESGICIAQRARANPHSESPGYPALDVTGIESWLREILREFARLGPVCAIVPVAHGAAMAVINDGRLRHMPPDYEWPGFGDRTLYDPQRDPFAATGSPPLPAGLNLGLQLHWLESLESARSFAGQIIPWAQFWAWTLCGVASSEVSSWGCHTDLWRPYDRSPSELALRRGWAQRFAPITAAGAALGTLRPEWLAATGLARTVEVYCGMHDSNAALLNARNHPELQGRDATVLSTGTWFVAMRTPLSQSSSAGMELPEMRDCLVNVDIEGAPVPSARFMGGREIELLAGNAAPESNEAVYSAALKAVEAGDMTLPSYVPGVGPYPNACARRVSPGIHREDALAKAHLYAALLADVSLDLIGSCDAVVVVGRFAGAPIFVQALANLRPTMSVLVGADEHGVAHGALQLAKRRPKTGALTRIAPLPADMSAYRSRWRHAAEHAD
jgi:sugar (pentulose or hexulose) kinase